MGNLTSVTEFLLMGISHSQELQILQGLLFLLLYLGALAGNLTITIIVTDPRLHSPMYFFISNVSLIDLCSISVIVPKLIVNSLTGRKSISLKECAAQIFLYLSFAFTELAFLGVMSYDGYVAICYPLHYALTFTPRLRCTQAVGSSGGSGLVFSAVHTGTVFRLPFTRSNVINQCFCDVPQFMRISSPEVNFSESISSTEARKKDLSTCTPQLVILLVFVFSGLIASLGPIAKEATLKNLLVAMSYTRVPPLLNPVLYSLRNHEINTALGRMLSRRLEKRKLTTEEVKGFSKIRGWLEEESRPENYLH
ncbi:olfactory receptor 14I1-like [Pteronotus mesoamericanus]|uniref:olfactory receptor 14I1-like n=1 Tax=Pteronotus mesoamericanus TaxID=1884717 RepID=UPI0023ED9C57|nr:olfactory receptor 14I1-like [Pteronotus parnellii mesoamericanus]